jgi:hypothetical protein
MLSINFNNGLQEFENLSELIKFLNSALYYSDEVYIFEPITSDAIPYSELDESDIEDYFSNILFYDCETLQVAQTF